MAVARRVEGPVMGRLGCTPSSSPFPQAAKRSAAGSKR